jgi:hypothetical protein
MKRTGAGKRLALTPRDIEIFRSLASYRYLRSTYLHAFAGGASETRLKERLGDLFHEGFIDRPARQWEFAAARHAPAVYEIGAGAERILAGQHCEDAHARTFLGSAAHRQFAHSLLICECLASIELATRTRSDLRFIPWGEILARAPERTRASAIPFRVPVAEGAVIPDGIFGLEYRTGNRKAYRFFALELDRGTMPIVRTNERQTSLVGKLTAYRTAIARGAHRAHLGIPNLLVLTVTTDAPRLRAALGKFGEAGSQPAFLFAAVEPDRLNRPVANLLLEPWERPGLPPLAIAESR